MNKKIRKLLNLKENDCLTCLGKGKIAIPYEETGNYYYDGDMFGFDTNTYKECPKCQGTGKN
jgi:hypothetical protein